MEKNLLLSKLKPFEGRELKLVHEQTVSDIIPEILKAHNEYKSEYDKICSYFVGATPYKTLKNIWSFLKSNVRYKIETEARQKICSPSAIISLGNVGLDCKNYALFSCGIIDAINRKGLQKIPFCFRFSSYRFWDKTPQHVFCVAFPGANEIWCDAVLKEFNYKKPYSYKIDKIPAMALYKISGVQTIGGKVQRKRRQAKRAQRNAECKGIKNKVKRVLSAPTRGAFTALVGLNAFGLARKLHEARLANEKELAAWWRSECGNPSVLFRSIERGRNKRRLFGDDESIGCICDEVNALYQKNSVGVAPALLAAKAAKLIRKVKKVLDKIKNLKKIKRVSTALKKTKKIRSAAGKAKDFVKQVQELSAGAPM